MTWRDKFKLQFEEEGSSIYSRNYKVLAYKNRNRVSSFGASVKCIKVDYVVYAFFFTS